MRHVNCQSLLPHFPEFVNFFGRGTFDIIALSETWLKPHIPDIMVQLPGYRIIRGDKEGWGEEDGRVHTSRYRGCCPRFVAGDLLRTAGVLDIEDIPSEIMTFSPSRNLPSS